MNHRPLRGLLRLFLLLLSGPLMADNSLGPHPYAEGYGFDRPDEAPWGGWKRGQSGTFYAEWDVFKDESHGGREDRTAAADVGAEGLTAAWAGWNVGTFISSTRNLYSFSVPETVRLNLAPAQDRVSPLRIVLQLESQGEGVLDAKYLRLNGRGPQQVKETYRALFDSSQGPVELAHYRAVFDLDVAPALVDIEFSMAQHTTIRQIAVDGGPIGEVLDSEDPTDARYPSQKAQINLAPEDLDPTVVTELFAQNPKLFPKVWPSSQLSFRQAATASGEKAKRVLSGKIKGLFYDTGEGRPNNEILIDLYREEKSETRKVAECLMLPRKVRRWAEVTLNGQSLRLGIAEYTLMIESAEVNGTTKIKKTIGRCDIDPVTPGIQLGNPLLKDGDLAVLRRP